MNGPSLSHSSMSILQSCPLRYKMSRIDGIKRLGITRGRRKGSAFSDALEAQDANKISEAYTKHMIEAVHQKVIDDLVIEGVVLPELFNAHQSFFGADDEREIEFDYMIEGTQYRNHGFMDGVTTITGDGVRDTKRVKEDKLMMMWGAGETSALPLNGQVLRYLGAAEYLWPDYDIELEYRVTRYPGTYRKVTEDAAEFGARVAGIIRDMRHGKKPHERFEVNVLKLNDHPIRSAVDRYYEDLVKYAQELDLRKDLDLWPAAWGDACKAYGGCEFKPACKQEPGFEELYSQKETV